jgi:site-specific recombinase XerC
MTEPRDVEITGQRARVARQKDPPEVGDILDAFVDEAPRKRGQSERTMETYRGHARSFLRYVLVVHGELDVPSLTDDDVIGFLAAAKARGDASTTRTTKLMSVRSFGAWMIDSGRHPGPILGQAVKPPCSTTAPRRPYRPQDANRFLESAWAEAVDLRRMVGAHIIALGFGSGLRPAELLNLTIAQVDLPDRRLHVIG